MVDNYPYYLHLVNLLLPLQLLQVNFDYKIPQFLGEYLHQKRKFRYNLLNFRILLQCNFHSDIADIDNGCFYSFSSLISNEYFHHSLDYSSNLLLIRYYFFSSYKYIFCKIHYLLNYHLNQSLLYNYQSKENNKFYQSIFRLIYSHVN